MKTPDEILPHQPRYKSNAWEHYSIAELGQLVHLLVKRSAHRADETTRKKDLLDAQNYLHMIQAHIDAALAGSGN
jgi:hypothetical protein